jgi:hypothetical protein
MPIAAGTRLGPYEVVSPLGAGGMGEVYRARDPRLDRDVAIKVLPRDVASDTERLRRFETEAKAASALNHPVLLTVFDIGRHQDAPYVVFELLEGQTLRERLDRGALPVRRAIDLAVQMAGGLAAAHDKGIVHRDLKPENLFLTRDGRVKILDFGLAKLRPGVAGGGDGTTDSAITGRGVVMGTVGYMSPEQVLGQAVDQRSDIFSLGVVLYEMLTGRRPFHRAASVETMSAILKEDPPELTDSVLGIPGGVARTVKRCLEKSPTDRFRSAHDLAFALEALSGPAPLPPRARRSRWLGPTAVATTALVLPVVGYVVGRAGRAPLVPTFQRLTHGRGAVVSARFTPDGRTVIYGASWGESPIRLYSTRTESPESAPLKLADANLFSVSPSGELAVSVALPSMLLQTFFSSATLATVPLAGEALNERLHDVSGADWSADGQLAAVRKVAGRYRLECPLGRVLYEAPPPSILVGVRVSPDGRHVAVGRSTWAENMGPPEGVMVLDREGRSTAFSEGDVGVSLAWTPRGDEIWLSTGVGRVEAMDLQGRRRVVMSLPGDVHLTDISKEGRVLLLIGDNERRMAVLRPGDAKEQELSLFGWSQVMGLSADGRSLLFSTLTRNAWFAYVRSTDASSAAVKLGPGFAQALSPDGAWAILEDPATVLSLVPTGPGDRRRLNTAGLKCADDIEFLPDARRALATCIADGRPPAAYVLDVDGRAPQRLTPEGTTCNAVSSREAACAASDADSWLAYPFSGGPPRPIPGIAPREQEVVQWSADGRSVFVREFKKLPQPVYLLDVETGRQRPWKTIVPREPAGTQFLSLLVTPDGRSYAYSYHRRRSDLWLVDGLVR